MSAAPKDEENMYNAVNRLVEILESHETQVEDDQHTNEVITRISDLITRMVDEDDDEDFGDSSGGGGGGGGGGGAPQTPATTSLAKSSKKSRSGRRGGPQTELPHYPTPYELWKKSHEVVERPAQLKLTEKERDKVTERLLKYQRKEHFSMMKTQHKKLAQELRGLTFAPNLDKTAKANKKLLGRRLEKLYIRYRMEIEKAKINRSQREQALRTREIAPCTFHPDISASNKNRLDTRGPETVADRCIQYGMDRRVRSEQRRDIIQRIENKQLTFKPFINKKSKDTYYKMLKQGRAVRPQDRAKTFEITGDNNDPGHEEDTFTPSINHRSQRITHDLPVFDRLYASAKQREQTRRKREREQLDNYVRNIPQPLNVADRSSMMDKASTGLSGVERSEIREGRKTSSKGPTGNDKINVCYWRNNYDFLAEQLGLA